MRARNDVVARTEQQESACTIRALGLALDKTLVAHEGALLITDKTTDLNPFQLSVSDGAVDFGGRHELR